MSAGKTWEEKWAEGRQYEEEAMRILMREGYMVLPVANLSGGPHAPTGPSIEGEKRRLAAPDILAFKDGKPTWVEVKYKEARSFYRNGNRWEVGIPTGQMRGYLEVEKATGIPVTLAVITGDTESLHVARLKDTCLSSREYEGPGMPVRMTFLWLDEQAGFSTIPRVVGTKECALWTPTRAYATRANPVRKSWRLTTSSKP